VQDEDRGVVLEADVRASVTVSKQAGLTWPMPADRRLDQLVDIANEAGASTRRNELAAALIASADPDGEVLLQLVLRWRRSRVRDVILSTQHNQKIVYLPRYKPGRRKAEGA
jgi:hypothetical protein